MKSTQWPINWSYDGDINKAKEFHGEGRALIGQLKNQTYGGANLGSNRLRKVYSNGVQIVAEILPGIDKVHIFVPLPEGEGKEKEEGRYDPYLWVGCRIKSGGTWTEGSTANVFSWLDYTVTMTVWEPPQADKLGQNFTLDDPNETEFVSTLRNGDVVIYFAYGTCDQWPMQTHRYYLDPSIQHQFISYGVPRDQVFQRRTTMEPYAERRYTNGPAIFRETITYQHTKDWLMSAGWINPYDPEYDHDDPDDDKIWYATIWCDPYTSSYDWPNGHAPIKVPRGIIASGPREGHVADDVEDLVAEGYGWWAIPSPEYPPPSEATARIIPGNYVVKIGVVANEHCPGHDLPIVIEVEARVGSPKFGGRTTKLRETITINAVSEEANYAQSIEPYGWWWWQHTSTGGIDADGFEIEEGWGACTHADGCWWQGAVLIDAFNGSINVLDQYVFADDPAGYTIHSSCIWGAWDDVPFQAGQTPFHDCPSLPCTSTPCGDGKGTNVFSKNTPITYPSYKGTNNTVYAHWVVTGSDGPFTYGYPYITYLAGRYAYVQCTWSGFEGDLPLIGDVLITQLFNHFVIICDEDYPTYNGERWGSWTLHQFGGGSFGGPVYLGDKVIVVIPDGGHLRIALPEKAGYLPLLRKFGPAEFDTNFDPPDGYI